MTKEEIFNYVMKDPSDTNANVLKSILSQLPSGGGGEWGSIIGNIEEQEDLITKFNTLDNKIDLHMSFVFGHARFEWDGIRTGHALINCSDMEVPSYLCKIGDEVLNDGKFFNSANITKTIIIDGRKTTETKRGSEFITSGTDIPSGGGASESRGQLVLLSAHAGTHEILINDVTYNVVVPEDGTYVGYEEDSSQYSYFSKIDDGTSTPSYIEQNGVDITAEVAEVLQSYLT